MFDITAKKSLCLIFVLLISGVSMVSGSYEPLLKRIPGSANVLVLIDVSALHRSQIGRSQDLRQRHEIAYRNQPILLPPSAKRAVIAGALDPGRLNLLWGLSVMQLREPVNMELLAKREGGLLDSLVGKKAMWSPLDAYFVELDTNTMATVYPARRQFTCRWLRSQQKNTAASVYLQKAAERANDKENDIVMALDLTDAPSPFHIAGTVKSSKVLAGTGFEAKALTELLSSIEGITLIVKVDKKVSGKITVHFGESAASMKGYAKDFLLEFLSEKGAYVNDFESWQTNVVGKRVILKGDLTFESLRRILSLIEIPTPTSQPSAGHKGSKAEESLQQAPQSTADKSREYFQTVKHFVEDLRGQARGHSGGRIAIWMEKYAVKIENLPIMDIDRDLQQYGANVAHYLRVGGDELRAASLSSQARKAQDLGGDQRYRARERKRIALEEKARGFGEAIKIFREIDALTSKIRLLLTERYRVEF